jgi:amicoumacin kinase
MRPDIKARFTSNMLRELAKRYGVSPDQLNASGGFESFIYQFNREGAGYILRVGHSERRGEAYVRGEVDWLNYLADGGASVAGAVRSLDGNLVETVADGHGESFVATAFQQAIGIPPWEFGWSPELYVTYGKMLGRMHALTTCYQPGDPLAFRPAWDHPSILDVEANLSRTDPLALEKFQILEERCRRLTVNRDAYGLIHFDIHAANFLVDPDGQITLFDFDDCNYNWFAYDLAIVLFFMVVFEEDKPAFTRPFLEKFFEGYRQEYRLDPAWLETIPMFLKMREIDLYGVIHRSFDIEHIDNEWAKGFMEGRKERIHADAPFVEMDFSKLAGWL